MPFWAYMLHCRGGVFYTGHTDNLEHRIAQHQQGEFPGFTSDRLPVELVWSDEFSTREEALAAELQIKGWSRKKKLALIRSDWEEISRLAKGKSGPSTSSGRTEPGKAIGDQEDPAELVERSQFMAEAEVITGTLAAAGRLDKALAEASGLSRERIKALMAEGAVTVGKTVATNPSAKMQAGAHFEVRLPPPEPLAAEPQDIPLTVVFEDDDLIVIDKPAGMVVHPAAGNPDGTLVNALLHHCAGRLSGIGGVARPGIVHRIDKDTSGLLVVAKSDVAHEGLSAQFADHSIERRYLAVCAGHPAPPDGTVTARLGRSDSDRKKMAVLPDTSSRGKHAVTHYRTLERLDHCALIECRLETGRTHQVRVHCASIGHPLVGDPVYGRTPKALRPLLLQLGFARQALHAASLGFRHPVTGEWLQFTAELPADMRELIDQTAR
ncbi:MAG: RluA family pseudouridine synthase [Sphingomonadaceae bacterium]|nr:RluA family pseudouridine synthase [Sphingomonadaceae bacterium]